jgi:hypothetical protein
LDARDLEILPHEQYCIYIQPRIATIFQPLLAVKAGLNPNEWARKGVPVLQLFFIAELFGLLPSPGIAGPEA